MILLKQMAIRQVGLIGTIMVSLAPAVAYDGLPPAHQRALEFGAVAQAATLAFDAEPVQGVLYIDESKYRAFSDTCAVEIGISYAFDQFDPLTPPDLITEARDLEFGTE